MSQKFISPGLPLTDPNWNNIAPTSTQFPIVVPDPRGEPSIIASGEGGPCPVYTTSCGITTLKLDSEQIFKVLSNFWDFYTQRCFLAKFWEGLGQVLDNEYIQVFQIGTSRSVNTVPTEWHYQWIRLDATFVDLEGVGAIHDHFFVEFTATGGETTVDIPLAVAPQRIYVYLNGVLLSDSAIMGASINWEYDAGNKQILFYDPLVLDDHVFVSWLEESDVLTNPHEHYIFFEQPGLAKSVWTDAVGDAFDPDLRSSYESGSADNPINVYANGVRQERTANYTEDSDTSLTLLDTITTPETIALHWRNAFPEAVPHSHDTFSLLVSSPQLAVELPFNLDAGEAKERVSVNGVLQIRGIDYSLQAINTLYFNGDTLVANDIVVVESWADPRGFAYKIDNSIIRMPFLQNGIDETAINGPDLCFREGVEYIVENVPDPETGVQIRVVRINQALDLDDTEWWIPDLYVNEMVIEKNFGDPVGFILENGEFYKLATRAFWHALWNGADIAIVENTLKALSNLPFTAEGGRVTVVRDNGDDTFLLRLDNGEEFTVPVGFLPVYEVNDIVPPFSGLSDGVKVYDSFNYPGWPNLVDDIIETLNKFSVNGPISGWWDDGGELDDGGNFDEWPEATEEEISDLVEAMKPHLFVVEFNDLVFAIDNPSIPGDTFSARVENYLASIESLLEQLKPAYTNYVIIVKLTGEEFEEDYFAQFPATDELDLDPSMAGTTESWDNFDDGGFFDTNFGGVFQTAATGIDPDISLPAELSYNVGFSEIVVYVDGVLQVITVGFNEIDNVTVEVVGTFSGGEVIEIYRDDTGEIPYDHRGPSEEVTIVLS